MKITKNENWFWIISYLFFVMGFILHTLNFEHNDKSYRALYITSAIAMLIIILINFDIVENRVISKIAGVVINMPVLLFAYYPLNYLVKYSLEGLHTNISIDIFIVAIIYFSHPLIVTSLNFKFISSKSIIKYILIALSYYLIFFIICVPLGSWMNSYKTDYNEFYFV